MSQDRLIAPVEAAGLQLGALIHVVPKQPEGPARGILLEMDDNNLVIQTAPGFEEVFRRSQVVAIRIVGERRRID